MFWALWCGITCKWGLFSLRIIYNKYNSLTHYNKYNSLMHYNKCTWLVNVCTLEVCNWFVMSMLDFWNSITLFEFLHSPSLYFVFMRRNQSFSITPRTTSVEETSNTNSYCNLCRGKQLFDRFCYYKHTRKYLPSFRSCRIYNSLRTRMNQHWSQLNTLYWCSLEDNLYRINLWQPLQ